MSGPDGDSRLGARLTELFAEATRRRVSRTTGVYLAGVWAFGQGLVELSPLVGVSETLLRALQIGALALTPLCLDEFFIGRASEGGVRFLPRSSSSVWRRMDVHCPVRAGTMKS